MFQLDTYLRLVWVATIFLSFISGATSDLIKSLGIPDISYPGGRINITCEYAFDKGATLYSLKWYHNETEFYRFVPTDQHKSVIFKPTLKFAVHEVARTDRKVTLQLTSLTSQASGEYKCEVIAEHPSFRTESKKATLIVLEEQPQPPRIIGAKMIYDYDDIILVKCSPQHIPNNIGPPSLSWYINGRIANPSYVRLEDYKTALILKVPAKKVASSSEDTKLECHSQLGDAGIKTSKRISVRIRKDSLLSFLSSGDTSRPLQPMMMFLCVNLLKRLL